MESDYSLSLEGVDGRQRTDDLIATDRTAALRVARGIRHPWYRCQALAAVAGAEPGARKRDELLDESLSAAYEQSEPNRIVSAATWPLAHLVRVDPGKARSVVAGLLETIFREPHGLRKLDGLAHVLSTVNRVAELREQVLPPFLSAAAASTGWRTEQIVAFASEDLPESDPKAALALLASRTPNRFSRQAYAKLRAAGILPDT
jgi:hypothetical protein